MLTIGWSPSSGVRPRGTQSCQALCPAHNDRSPSLSVNPHRDGTGIVVTCHAGCNARDIVAAVGLTISDLFDSPAVRDPYSPTRTYQYPGGRHVHRKPDGNGGKTYRNPATNPTERYSVPST